MFRIMFVVLTLAMVLVGVTPQAAMADSNFDIEIGIIPMGGRNGETRYLARHTGIQADQSLKQSIAQDCLENNITGSYGDVQRVVINIAPMVPTTLSMIDMVCVIDGEATLTIKTPVGELCGLGMELVLHRQSGWFLSPVQAISCM